MKVKICRKWWRLQFCRLAKNYGDIDPPTQTDKAIRIDSSLRGRKLLEILLHESHHGGDWRADEDHIRELSHDQSVMLWRLGYRRQGEEE